MSDEPIKPVDVLADLTKSLAEGIVSNLTDGLAGAASSVALGFLNSALGLGEGDKTALQKIETILNQIAVALNDMRAEIQSRFDQQDLDSAEGKVAHCISMNSMMLAYYQDLSSCGPGGLKTQLKVITDGLDQNVDESMIFDWFGVMLSTGGTTSIIEALQRKIADKAQIYGPKAAAEAENLWRYYDMQQAMTLVFTIERFVHQEKTTEILPTIRRWIDNRKQQLAQLRGMASAEDRIWIALDGDKNSTEIVTSINHLPAGCAISRPQKLMWSLDLTRRYNYAPPPALPSANPIFEDPEFEQYKQNYLKSLQAFHDSISAVLAAGVAAVTKPDGSPFSGWRQGQRDEFIALEVAAGSLAGSDVFVGVFKELGFQFDESQAVAILTEWHRQQAEIRVWGQAETFTDISYFVVYEQRDWSLPDGSLPYIIPACRPVTDAELATYIQS